MKKHIDRSQRMVMLRQAQDAQTNPSATVPPIAQPTATIDVRSAPGFNAALFNTKPAVVNDINNIANIINKYLSILSGGKVVFSIVWTNPSITGSEYYGGTKNLLNLAKWIYNVVRAKSTPYSLEGLKELGKNIIETTDKYSFPEPTAANVKSELVAVGYSIINKIAQ
jgi:hypothetical protein